MKVLSYGVGVNSTAILALVKLGKYPMPDKIIFCDTGAERPETYCYLNYISKLFPVETIKSKMGTLIDYCNKYKVIPARMTRWCTVDFKMKPFNDYLKGIEHTKILGISADESHRVRDDGAEYPLVEMLITRSKCIELIKEAGLEMPVKSGCYICPFMKKSELRLMKEKHPELFAELVGLEKQANDRNKKIFFKEDKLINEYVSDDTQEMLDGFENYQNCFCKFD